MNKRNEQALIADMRHAAEEIAKIVSEGREKFESNEWQRRAAERYLEIIGEAAGLLSEDFRLRHADLSIREAKDQRNVIVHDYWEVNYDRLWNTMTINVPDFAAGLPVIRDAEDP